MGTGRDVEHIRAGQSDVRAAASKSFSGHALASPSSLPTHACREALFVFPARWSEGLYWQESKKSPCKGCRSAKLPCRSTLLCELMAYCTAMPRLTSSGLSR